MEVPLEKFKRITPWLKELYLNEAFPHHKMTEQIIDALYQLAEYNEAVDNDFAVLIKDMKQSATEYEEKTKYLAGVLKRNMGISMSCLSRKGRGSIGVLVKSAVILDTKDTSLTSFFGAINSMASEIHATELQNKKMELELRLLKERLAAAKLREDQLRKDLGKSKINMRYQKAILTRKINTIGFLQRKTLDLKCRAKNGEKQLTAMELDPSLTHGELISLSERLSEDEKALEILKTQVEPYANLSPSLPLAQVKIEELKHELSGVEEEFTQEVNKIFFKEV